MVVALALVGLAPFLSVLLAYHLFTRAISIKQAELENRIQKTIATFVSSPEPGKPSPLGEILDSVGVVVGSAAARNIMKSLGGADGRAGIQAEAISGQLQAEQNPLVGLLSGGKRGKGAALMRLAELLGPMITQRGQFQDGNHANERSVHDRLKGGT